MGLKEETRKTFTTCRDCVYGYCRNGICYSCSEWEDRIGVVDDCFFCDKALSREQARVRIQDTEKAKCTKTEEI